jgi:hypothetical protein
MNNDEAKIISLASKAFLDTVMRSNYLKVALVLLMFQRLRRSPVGQSFILVQFSLYPGTNNILVLSYNFEVCLIKKMPGTSINATCDKCS